MKKETVAIFVMLMLMTVSYMPIGVTDEEQPGSEGMTITGLEFEGLTETWHSTGVTLTNSYVNLTLTPKQLLVPDELDDLNTNCVYNFQEWHGNQAWMHVTLTYYYSYAGWYGHPDNYYPHVDLDALLGGSQWTTSEYPANWFNVGPIQTIATGMEDERFIFELDPITSGTTSWVIKVTSHYQYVIIDYELWYNDEILVYTFQDVYEGGDPDLLAVNYQLNKYDDTTHKQIVDRALMRYDNLYGENKTVNVTIAYPYNKELLEFFSETSHTEIDEQYSIVESIAINLEKQETLLESTDGFTIKTFSVNISENSNNVIYFCVPSSYGEFNDLSMWITGSFAGGTGTTANPYQITTVTQLQAMRDYLSNSFILNNNIDASGVLFYGVGNGTDPFTGTFDGNELEIYDIEITNSSGGNTYSGLFGNIHDGARIRDIGVHGSVDSFYYTGLLVGSMDGAATKISYSFTDGTVDSNGWHVGGLVGLIDGGTVEYCYSFADVNGYDYAGGLAGSNGGTVIECFSTGAVSSDDDVGGLIASSWGTVTRSYWNNQTSGLTTSGGGTGRTTSQMTDWSSDYPDAYDSWDFSDVWVANSWNMDRDLNSGYPAFQWQSDPTDNDPPTIDAHSPTNQSVLSYLQPIASVTVSDPNYGDTLSVVFSSNHTGSWVNYQTNSSIPYSGETVYWNFTNASDWNTVYYWRVNVTDGSNTTFAIYHFETNSIPQLSTPTIDPASGNESDTVFEINVTITDIDNDTQSVYAVATYGAWSNNQSMSWVSGDNSSGANYTLSTNYTQVGVLSLIVYTYDGGVWNSSSAISLTVLGNASFQINFPSFLLVGQYIFADGSIKDATGDPVSSIWATTTILNSTFETVAGSTLDKYIVDGTYRYTFSTTLMTPGIYYINIDFTYGGNDFFNNRTLYLSDYTGPGHIATNAYFSFYDADTGVGIEPLSFKIYASHTSPIVAGDRIYGNTFRNTYTGATLYYRIDDYFDNVITSGSTTIDSIDYFIDVPINWNSFSVKNMNSSIIYFTITNDTRTYSQYLFPYEAFYWNVLDGDYNITMNYYDPVTSVYDETKYADISITADSYYFIQGYDLRDIIIEVTAVNTSIDTLSIDISAGVTLTDSSVQNISIRMLANLTATESNITNLIISQNTNISLIETIVNSINTTIWTNLSIIDSVVDTIDNKLTINFNMLNLTVDYINNTIWTELTFINSSIDYLNTTVFTNFSFINTTIGEMDARIITMWSSQNSSFESLENRSTIVFNYYNTNEGLGLDRETLKVYINGSRLINNIYYTYNTSDVINVTIQDYYNSTLFHQNFTITAPFTFIDLGLTFHSWLFGNKNEEYYMISILKQGAARWWERGIVPNGEREFLIPSGTYALRIYDPDWVEIYNSTLPASLIVNNSRVYVIEGSNLSEVLSGQSVIRGQLLELRTMLQDATRPSIVRLMSNVPHAYNILECDGALIGTELICPVQAVTATTRNTSYANMTMQALIPDNSTATGSILIKRDTLYLSGPGATTWVNVTYNGVSTNYSYIPNRIVLFGGNVAVYSSHNITLTRETTYQEQLLFYWTKYTATSRYTSTNDITNYLNTTLYEIYSIIQFANDTLPDYNTVTVYDVTNGEYMTSGENFVVSANGYHMYLDSITANTTRSFTGEYYAQTATQQPNDAIVVVYNYYMEEDNNETYFYVSGAWTNKGTDTFIGPLEISFNFDEERQISSRSLIVYDETNNRYLDRDEFSFTGSGVRILQDTMGTVNPGNTRTFSIYFDFMDGDDIPSAQTYFLSMYIYQSIQMIHIIVVLLAAIAVSAARSNWKKYKPLVFLLAFIAALAILMYLGGV